MNFIDHLSSMAVHDCPEMNFLLIVVTRNTLDHPDGLNDGPVLVVVPLALHAEHAAVPRGFTPLSHIRGTSRSVKTKDLSEPFGNLVVLEEPEDGEDDEDAGDDHDEEGVAEAEV